VPEPMRLGQHKARAWPTRTCDLGELPITGGHLVASTPPWRGPFGRRVCGRRALGYGIYLLHHRHYFHRTPMFQRETVIAKSNNVDALGVYFLPPGRGTP
jgi:hypothetical protein